MFPPLSSRVFKTYREFLRNAMVALRVAYDASPAIVWGVLVTSLLISFIPAVTTVIWRDLINGAAAVFSAGGDRVTPLLAPFAWLVFITFAEIALTGSTTANCGHEHQHATRA